MHVYALPCYTAGVFVSQITIVQMVTQHSLHLNTAYSEFEATLVFKAAGVKGTRGLRRTRTDSRGLQQAEGPVSLTVDLCEGHVWVERGCKGAELH